LRDAPGSGRSAHAMRPFVVLACAVLTTACASQKMGVVSDLSRVEGPAELCEHKVPEQVCVKHHPELAAKFKAVNDWCGPHDVAESQCFQCHPELTFEALPKVPESADYKVAVNDGSDVAHLSTLAAAGKVTVVDFFADWCVPCREIDLHLLKKLKAGETFAVRKLNVVDWDTPLAKRHLAEVKALPYLVVFDANGNEVKRLQGFDLAALDAALASGAAK
jgi:thiol-disulfide isomerase/thioredoxin